uniref:Uncharacterized protein n=1 Tax=Trichuris muris TaxID=70415 RepID=A0A5S6QDN7_TRIMR
MKLLFCIFWLTLSHCLLCSSGIRKLRFMKKGEKHKNQGGIDEIRSPQEDAYSDGWTRELAKKTPAAFYCERTACQNEILATIAAMRDSTEHEKAENKLDLCMRKCVNSFSLEKEKIELFIHDAFK